VLACPTADEANPYRADMTTDDTSLLQTYKFNCTAADGSLVGARLPKHHIPAAARPPTHPCRPNEPLAPFPLSAPNRRSPNRT
jgi:hypothetical protein